MDRSPGCPPMIETVPATMDDQPRAGGTARLAGVYVLFALSGAAGLIYEVVWFQLLRFTVGANAQTLAVLLACFMGGLFAGSALAARVVPARWHPLKAYAALELGIAACAVMIPTVSGAVRGLYFSFAATAGTAMVLRLLIVAVLLIPPTVLMGATLPLLSRHIRNDRSQCVGISRLYAANILGAVAGSLGTVFLLAPVLGYPGANQAAVGLNVLVAAVALGLSRTGTGAADPDGSTTSIAPEPDPQGAVGADDAQTVATSDPPGAVAADNAPGAVGSHGARGAIAIYLAYALSGCAALSFEVLWSRLLAMICGATVYAFALVLGVFLFGLAAGSALGAGVARRIADPRTGLAATQAMIVAAVGATSLLVPWTATALAPWEKWVGAQTPKVLWVQALRTVIVALPGAVLFGASFALALRALGDRFADPARPVGRLYAFNTVGAIIGALGTGFVIIPVFGSQTAAAQLLVLPLAAMCLLLVRLRPAGYWIMATGAVAIVFFTPLVTRCAQWMNHYRRDPDDISDWVWIIAVPVFIGATVLLVRHARYGWAYPLAIIGLVVALCTEVPAKLYALGRKYAGSGISRQFSDILLFEEGVMEPVAVFFDARGNMLVGINSRVCASSNPGDMQLQRMIGHLPVLLSRDPTDCLVVGLGAGVTAGAVAIHPTVRKVWIAELEPKVVDAAACFGRFNDDVVHDPKVTIVIDDGRHFIAAGGRKYGVITSDPVHPRIAGAAALFTADYFALCRDHLTDGGVFAQWVGLYELPDDGLRSILSAFAEAFPHGTLWMTATDAMLIGSPGPLVIDLDALTARLAAAPAVRASLDEINVSDVPDLLRSFICTCASIKDDLAGAVVNRDANLYLQFSAGLGWYEWHQPRLVVQCARWRQSPERLLRGAPDHVEALHRTIDQRWKSFDATYIQPQRDALKRMSEDHRAHGPSLHSNPLPSSSDP